MECVKAISAHTSGKITNFAKNFMGFGKMINLKTEG
jgi:hypothetical protein